MINYMNFSLFIILGLILLGVSVFILVLIIKALIKYNRTGETRKEKSVIKKSLGEILKTYRTNCKMTQEFVAESLGVSRQAVSKWENGTSDPSTSNLIALAKLYGVTVEELLSSLK